MRSTRGCETSEADAVGSEHRGEPSAGADIISSAVQPNLTGTTVRLSWAHQQLSIALEILDNPGGGLVFGYQAMGQVRAHLAEATGERYATAIALLEKAEANAVLRNFPAARESLSSAIKILPES